MLQDLSLTQLTNKKFRTRKSYAWEFFQADVTEFNQEWPQLSQCPFGA
ncbi:hypothetical protein Riv7116_4427 [Rivularia sp. PCC 7116]|nr:hypothetical protein Riv7116_4427 [Rivularia sp. PCC 7116]